MTTGVLLMAHGTPDGPADVARFYTAIRRGQAPSPEQLRELQHRYDAIGGVSPLHASTEAQARRLQELLGNSFDVRLGFKHTSPSIQEAARALDRSEVDAVLGVVLAPHFSVASVGEYHRRARAVLRRQHFVAVASWHDHPRLIDALATRVSHRLREAPPDARVVFTAHSLPVTVPDVEAYAAELSTTAALVTRRLGIAAARARVAWQSQGRTRDAWLTPDLRQALSAAARDGVPHIVVCPAGFVADHLETLYDLDIEAAHYAAGLRVGFSRTEALELDAAEIVATIVLDSAAKPLAVTP